MILWCRIYITHKNVQEPPNSHSQLPRELSILLQAHVWGGGESLVKFSLISSHLASAFLIVATLSKKSIWTQYPLSRGESSVSSWTITMLRNCFEATKAFWNLKRKGYYFLRCKLQCCYHALSPYTSIFQVLCIHQCLAWRCATSPLQLPQLKKKILCSRIMSVVTQ